MPVFGRRAFGAGIGCADCNAGADADRNARTHRSAGIERDGSAGHAYARAAGDGASRAADATA